MTTEAMLDSIGAPGESAPNWLQLARSKWKRANVHGASSKAGPFAVLQYCVSLTIPLFTTLEAAESSFRRACTPAAGFCRFEHELVRLDYNATTDKLSTTTLQYNAGISRPARSKKVWRGRRHSRRAEQE
jgi:hypothetical protein